MLINCNHDLPEFVVVLDVVLGAVVVVVVVVVVVDGAVDGGVDGVGVAADGFMKIDVRGSWKMDIVREILEAQTFDTLT